MCDPVYALFLKKQAVQQEFFSQLSPEERDCFFSRDAAGKSYSDLMHQTNEQMAVSYQKYRENEEKPD